MRYAAARNHIGRGRAAVGRSTFPTLVLAGLAVFCGTTAVVGFSPPVTAAPLSVSCTASGHTVVVSVSGSATDSLVVTTSGGTSIEIDKSAACSTTYTDSSSTYPNIQVTETSSPYVPVVFQPGTDPGIDFIGPAETATRLDLSAIGMGTTVTLNGDSPGSPGAVELSGGSDTFSGISTFVGSSAGDTTFVAGGAGGYTFEGSGSGNQVDLSADPNSVTANLSTGSIGVASGSTDTVSGISSVVGSSAGGNTFVAGNGSESFADSGSVGGDTLDFSDVATSTSTPLTINVSGGQVNGESNDTATEGSTTYSFTSGGTDFTTFLGATTGHTSFLAGPTGGATFDGQGSSNTLNFMALVKALTVNVSGVMVGPVSNSTAATSGTTYAFSDISAFVGSSGGTTFYAGSAADTFAGSGTSGNTLNFADHGGPNIDLLPRRFGHLLRRRPGSPGFCRRAVLRHLHLRRLLGR